MATSETVPFSKSGGLADVVGALSATLTEMGNEVRIFMPMYSFIEKEGWHKSLSFLIPMLGTNERAEIYEKEVNGKKMEKDLAFADFYDEEGEKVDTERLIDFLQRVMKWQSNKSEND